MLRLKMFAAVLFVFALGVSPVGGGSDLRLRVLDETSPAGGIVQMKVRTYEVTPISIGRPSFTFETGSFDEVAGIGMFAGTGELAGAAVVEGNRVSIAFAATAPFTDDYPFLTVAMRLRPDLAVGSQTRFTLDPSSLWTVNGSTIRSKVRAGVVRVGGSVAISDVIPGAGWFPAGTVVTVRGLGFNSRSRVKADGISINNVRFVSPTEMRFTLRQGASLTAARVRVDNEDDSRSTYYSYMRGIPAATSSRVLLSTTQPIFSDRVRSLSTVGPLPTMDPSQYFALALQNLNLAAAQVNIGLYDADGTLIHSSARSLAGGHRLALELSELLDGLVPTPGTFVRVTSSPPIVGFGLFCDEGAWAVTPWLPTESGFSGASGSANLPD